MHVQFCGCAAYNGPRNFNFSEDFFMFATIECQNM